MAAGEQTNKRPGWLIQLGAGVFGLLCAVWLIGLGVGLAAGGHGSGIAFHSSLPTVIAFPMVMVRFVRRFAPDHGSFYPDLFLVGAGGVLDFYLLRSFDFTDVQSFYFNGPALAIPVAFAVPFVAWQILAAETARRHYLRWQRSAAEEQG